MPFCISPDVLSTKNMALSWLEIGTADFDTFIQSARVKDGTRGMSIEPLSLYLDRLPDRPDVIKVNGAISNQDGEMNIYYVAPKDITKYNMPAWVKGCNTIGKPHPNVVALFDRNNLSLSLISKQSVKIMTPGTLIEKYNITSIGILKIDTEGHDCTILHALIDYCDTHPTLYPQTIFFESNELTPKTEVNDVINRLKERSYILLTSGNNTILSRM